MRSGYHAAQPELGVASGNWIGTVQERESNGQAAQRLRTVRHHVRPRRYRPATEIEVGEPTDSTEQRKRDRAIRRHFGLWKPWRNDSQPVGADPAVMWKRRRRRMHPPGGVGARGWPFDDVKRGGGMKRLDR